MVEVEYMKKFFENKKVRKILLVILIISLIWLILTVLTFKNAIDYATSGKYYKEARAYMAAAEKMNDLYIFPLSHMTHWEHPITKPFYAIRDYLYYTGLSKFPKNEGEREVWWYKIRYVEFRELVEDNLVSYQLKKDYAIPKFVYSKVARFHDWDNELYNHIKPIADSKITDKKLSKFKLDMFVQLSRLYVSMDSLLAIEPRFITYQKIKDFIPKINWVSDKESQKYDKIYRTYLNLLTYSKKYDKLSYDYFYNDINNRRWGWFLAHEVSKNIITSRFYNNKLTCDDFYLKLYADNQKIMRDYYDKYEKTLSYGVRARMSLSTSGLNTFIAYKFRHCKHFSYCSDDVLKSIKELNKEYGSEDNPEKCWKKIVIANISELEKEKRYEELKRVKIILSNK